MRQTDKGVMYKLWTMILILWAVICWGVLLSIVKAGYTNQYLEDCLTQANLAALVIDPYHYGSSGELIFQNVKEVKEIFEQVLEKGLGDEESRKKLGIVEDVQLLEFRVYEVKETGITEVIFGLQGSEVTIIHSLESLVTAPDGTEIQNSAIYAKISVPIEFLFGIKVTAVKEHCVDIISEETENE